MHMALETNDYEPLYLAGIEKFNECDYYESHEVWEELWTEYRGPSRKFYQGLIQAAVALYHFGNGNIRGARKLHGSVHGYLEPYAPKHLGLDLGEGVQRRHRLGTAAVSTTKARPRRIHNESGDTLGATSRLGLCINHHHLGHLRVDDPSLFTLQAPTRTVGRGLHLNGAKI
jgi:predicted metal-dependent hydrolase